jgi:hypothetical protein
MDQPGWRWCSRCQGLFRSGIDPSLCAVKTGDPHHDGSTSGAYVLEINGPARPNSQPQWSCCTRCASLFYGPGASSSVCPAGGGHAAGTDQYTMDLVGAAPTAQAGWRWCNRCQSLFFGPGMASSVCAAGGAHTADGSGEYVMRTAETAVPLNLLTAWETPTVFGRGAVSQPSFLAAEQARLAGDLTAVIHAEDSSAWCTVPTWAGLPSTVDPVVVCQRSGVTISFAATAQAQPLPFTQASAELTLGSGQPLPLQVLLDSTARELKLTAVFDPSVTGAGSYDATVGALTAGSGAALMLDFTHAVRVHTPASGPPPQPSPQPARPQPASVPIGRFHPLLQTARLTPAAALATEVPVPAPAPAAAAPVPAAAAPVPAAAAPVPAAPLITPAATFRMAAIHVDMANIVRLHRDDLRLFVGGTPDGYHDAAVEQRIQLTLPAKTLAPPVFPDIPQPHSGTWGQLHRDNQPTLFYHPSDQADLYYHLPSAYQLGLRADGDDPARAPVQVSLAKAADGRYVVTASLSALPYLADADRRDLHDYVDRVVLSRTQPYVALCLRAGMAASFTDEFTAGGDRVGVASITYALVGVSSDSHLSIDFTMNAADYPIFVELLRKGIRGEVTLSDGQFTAPVPVLLALDDLVTNALTVRVITADATAGAAGGGGGAGGAAGAASTVEVNHALAYPVQLRLLAAELVYYGHEAGYVFDAEEVPLVQSLTTLPPASAALVLPVRPTRISAWNQTIPVSGASTVDGGSIDDWLARIHQDPSLQPTKLSIQIDPNVPSAHAADVRSVSIRVYDQGATTPRQSATIPADQPSQLELELTLAELAGQAGQRTAFLVEYDARYADDRRSLPQRVALDLTMTTMIIDVLYEPVAANYFVEAQTTVGPVTRDVANQVIDTLRPTNQSWTVRAVATT